MTRFAGDAAPAGSRLDRILYGDVREREEFRKIPAFSVNPGAASETGGSTYFDPNGKEIRRGQIPAFGPGHGPGIFDRQEFLRMIDPGKTERPVT
jgi:hypothetical protein